MFIIEVLHHYFYIFTHLTRTFVRRPFVRKKNYSMVQGKNGFLGSNFWKMTKQFQKKKRHFFGKILIKIFRKITKYPKKGTFLRKKWILVRNLFPSKCHNVTNVTIIYSKKCPSKVERNINQTACTNLVVCI